MTIHPPLIFSLLIFLSLCLPHRLHALGSGATLAVISSTATVCGIVAGEPTRRIQCYQHHKTISIQPNISYDFVSGGGSFFCGLSSGGYVLLCWDIDTFTPKRVYHSYYAPLREISVGGDQVCGVINGTNRVQCWRGLKGSRQTLKPLNSGLGLGLGFDGFQSISSGFNFSCGILLNNSRVRCWGINSSLAAKIEYQFADIRMSSIVAGGNHVCGLNSLGFLVCKGSNLFGQLDFPVSESSRVRSLALGFDYSCGIRQSNGSVLCWGSRVSYLSTVTRELDFETLVGGLNFICGLITSNLNIICSGPGWLDHGPGPLGLPKILPGPCVHSNCSLCGLFPESQTLCLDSGNICNSCVNFNTIPPSPPPSGPPPPPPPPPPSKGLTGALLAFAIVGSVGSFSGICSIIYCLYTGVCWGRKKVHNSVQPTVTRGGSGTSRTSSNGPGPPLRSLTIRRQGSRIMRRQRSGTSSTKHDRAEEFSFQGLEAATNNFSWENKIGSGSFGVVYKGKLADGREVAIKRSETGPRTKKLQEKESAFESELSFLSRLHHKHLVRLVGYCDERDERLLVYEYMKHGALYDHLHNKNSDKQPFSVINSWKMRIKIALDAARGIEYLHSYAVPPIIHRDIKSSNILLDDNWTARVSDFGLSLMGPENNRDIRPLNAAGTIGYIDPEYYGMNVLTAKSDVYGFGVVLLELLTGKKAIFKGESEGGELMTLVDFVCPKIMAGELGEILDPRVGPPPESNESEAVELVAYTALHCVNLEGKDRPSMTDIVANLERALALCVDNSHDYTSSTEISVESD